MSYNKEQIKEYNRQYRQKHKESIKEYRQKHKEQQKEHSRQHYQKHKEQIKEYRQKHKEQARRNTLKYSYNITPELYQQKLLQQNNVCAICGSQTTGNKRSVYFALDHDHEIEKKTGKIFVRGLLCNFCNHGLGHFKDNLELLNKAIKYLEHWKKVFQTEERMESIEQTTDYSETSPNLCVRRTQTKGSRWCDLQRRTSPVNTTSMAQEPIKGFY